MATNTNSTANSQCSEYESSALKTAPKSHSRSTANNDSNNIIQGAFNFQLLYDIN